jgi:hypothetical protein
MRIVLVSVAAIAALFAATPASALLLNFDFSDGYSFALDSDPTPIFGGDGATYVETSRGMLGFFDPDSFQFNFSDGTGNRAYFGPKLYSNTEQQPHFDVTSSSINLTDLSSNPLTLSISSAGPGAPSPEVGMGILSALAAGAALFFTRRANLRAELVGA